jgi:NADH-quinone oxidoreductase subunit I
MMSYLKSIVFGGLSLVEGMAVTFRRLFQPLVTVQYPREKIPLSHAYRGHIELKSFEDTGTHKCIACGSCERVCPSCVIRVKGVKQPAASSKIASQYIIDFSKCSLCGLCVECCPTHTLQFSKEYELVGETRKDCIIDLIARIASQCDKSKTPEGSGGEKRTGGLAA